MKTIGTAILAAAILVASFGPAGARTQGTLVAITRCDSKNINEDQDTVQAYERHPARGSTDQLKELGDLQYTIQSLGQERGVLDAVCPETMSRAAFNSQIAAVQGWAYALQADMSIALGPPCPTAGNAIPNQLLAEAWFALAGNVIENGSAVPSVAAIIPKVQSRAAKIGLTLPAAADTSSYWVSTITDASKAAITACHLPPPTPTPVPTPVDTPGP
jgi:hypothetical protein